MKNFFKFMISSLLLLSFININAFAETNVPNVEAEGMILIDVQTGEILAEKDANKKFAPASTTKIMTTLLTLENTKLDDMVTVGETPPYAEGSSIALKEGDVYSVEDLLHGLLLESANDVAMALAEHIAGSEEEFAKLMTKRAKELGAKNTNFANASGLTHENHYTTAYDLSLIMKEVIKHKDYIRISQVISYELPKSKVDGQTKWTNNSTNLFNPNSQNYYDGFIAGKTGYTNAARFTYVSAAQKENQTLISVLLKAESKTINFENTKQLFDFGFNNFDLVKLYDKNDTITTLKIDEETEIPLNTPKDIYYVSDNRNTSKETNEIVPNIVLENKEITNGSFSKGDNIISANISVNGENLTTLELVSGVDFEYTLSNKVLDFAKKNIFLISLGIILLIGLLFFVKERFFYFRYKRRHNRILFGKKKNKIH